MAVSEVGGHFENEDASVRVSAQTGGWFFEANDGLTIQVTAIGDKSDMTAHVGIYGTADGLAQLADLLMAIASVDQTQIADRNCPPSEGMHVTLRGGADFRGPSVALNIGRLDSKRDGSTTWFEGIDQVCWRPE
jgi:hypothetical protein